jgi:hypothetical protein
MTVNTSHNWQTHANPSAQTIGFGGRQPHRSIAYFDPPVVCLQGFPLRWAVSPLGIIFRTTSFGPSGSVSVDQMEALVVSNLDAYIGCNLR